jgi:methylase of polypeptide subunit release factors
MFMNSRAPNQICIDDAAIYSLESLMRAVRIEGYRFITPTPATYERVNARAGNEWAVDTRGVFGWSRKFRHELLPPGIFELMQLAHVAEPYADGWRSRVRLSTLDDQLFVHSAYPTDDSNDVFFGPDTYRYAAAIERHIAMRVEPVARAVDIGSGAGPGAVQVAKAWPQAQVWAVDINDLALRLTTVNARLAQAPNVIAAHSDLLGDVDGEFDLIIANPPYLLDPQERTYRHGGGTLGMGLSLSIVDSAVQRLARGGSLVLYTGVAIVDGQDAFREQSIRRLDAAGFSWTYREMDPDVFGEELMNPAYADTERIAAVVLTATRG